MARQAKRPRVDVVANADSAAPPAPLLRSLVESVLLALQLDVSLVDSPSLKLLALRHAPSIVGVGVCTSDMAVRLFHAHGGRITTTTSSTSTTTGDDQEMPAAAAAPRFTSSAALAAFCVDVMQQQRHHFAAITSIELPDAAAQAAGVLRDRILIKTRQFARELHQETPLEDRIQVLFRDDAVVVVHKPANMLSVDSDHSGSSSIDLSVQRLVRAYFPDARMVHRLDQETSGILVVALTKTAAQHLNRQFRERSVDKRYMARVHGHVAEDAGIVELCMAPSATERLVQRVVEDGSGGAATRTEWRVLERGDGLSTLMELKPVTGKTHQLRVHMQHLGHAILGDSLYAAAQVQRLAPRLLLHAAQLSFTHPVSGQRIRITCKCGF